jgi:hypothetical protein
MKLTTIVEEVEHPASEELNCTESRKEDLLPREGLEGPIGPTTTLIDLRI